MQHPKEGVTRKRFDFGHTHIYLPLLISAYARWQNLTQVLHITELKKFCPRLYVGLSVGPLVRVLK